MSEKEEIYKNLSEICQKKLQNEPKKQKIYQNIEKILSYKNSFKQISFEVAINILLDLDFSKQQAVEIYKQLVK